MSDCSCLECGPKYPFAWERYVGRDETEGRYADVALRRCASCRRLWLRYAVEREFYTSAGKWAEALIGEADAESMIPEEAAGFIDRAEWCVVGGGFYNSAGLRTKGPIQW